MARISVLSFIHDLCLCCLLVLGLGRVCCACLPLGVAFPPLSSSLLTFANSPVTKGCAGRELTTSCGICAGVPSPGLQASSFLFSPAARMCTASKKQGKAAFLETSVCSSVQVLLYLSWLYLCRMAGRDGTSEVPTAGAWV